MAAPYVASKGTASAVTTGASTPTYPASIAADDIVFLLAISHQPVSIGVIDTPTGFAEVAQGTYQNNSSVNQGRAALFWRRATGSLTGTVSVTKTGDTGTDGVFYSQIYRVVGAKTTGDPWDAVATDYGPGNATVDIADVTVSGAERTLIAFIAQADNASTVDPPSGYVGLVTDTTATGTDAELRCVHKRNVDDAAATTATGGETEGWATFHLSMAPAVAYSAPSIVLTGDALRMDGPQDVLRLDYADSTGLLYCTVTCWAKISVDRGTYSTIFAIEDGAGHSTAYNELITDADGTTMSVYDHVTGDLANVQAMTVGTWYAFGFKITAGAWKSYVGTEGFTSLTTGTGSLTNILFNDLFGVGSTTFTASESLNGMLSMFRVWSAALSDAEIKAELQSSRPVRINDLVGAWLPLGVGSGTELDATYGNDIVSRGVGTPDWTFAAGPLLTLLTSGAATEGDDTASGAGTVGSSGVTCSGTPTEGADTGSGSGVVITVGSGTPTEGADTSEGTAYLVVASSGAVTEGADTAAGVGLVGVTSSGAVSEGADTASGSGALVPVATGTPTEGTDTATGAGTVIVVSSGALSEDSDTCSGSGVVGDAVAVTGSGIVTEGADTASGVGAIVIVGSGSYTEGADTATGTAYLVVASSGAVSEGSDTATGAGTLVPVATGAVTEQSDSASGSARVVIVSVGSITELGDTSTGIGVVGGSPITTEGAFSEGADTATGAGTVVASGAGTLAEGADTATGSGLVGITSTGTPTEGSDTTSGTLRVGEVVTNYAAPGELFSVVSVVQKSVTCSIVQEGVTVTVF